MSLVLNILMLKNYFLVFIQFSKLRSSKSCTCKLPRGYTRWATSHKVDKIMLIIIYSVCHTHTHKHIQIERLNSWQNRNLFPIATEHRILMSNLLSGKGSILAFRYKPPYHAQITETENGSSPFYDRFFRKIQILLDQMTYLLSLSHICLIMSCNLQRCRSISCVQLYDRQVNKYRD